MTKKDTKKDPKKELTVQHLTAALAHAEGYITAVRNALNSMESTGAIALKNHCLEEADGPYKPSGCNSEPFSPGCCPPPESE